MDAGTVRQCSTKIVRRKQPWSVFPDDDDGVPEHGPLSEIPLRRTEIAGIAPFSHDRSRVVGEPAVSQRVLTVIGPLALFGLIAGCGIMPDARDLPESTWTVVEVDGEAVPAGEIYLLFGVETATLRTRVDGARGGIPGCRDSVSEIVWDSDGHALNFLGFVDERLGAQPCDPAMAALHDRIAGALRDNESWESDAESLQLIGTSRVRLLPADPLGL
jgi:hypothetical protein